MSDTRKDILDRLLSWIADEYDKSVGSFFYDTQAPLAIEHEAFYERLEKILDQSYAKTASKQCLEYKVAEQGLTRRAATYSTGTVTITGDYGSVIPSGCKVASDLAVYTVAVPYTIPIEGTCAVSITCDIAGSIGNVPVGAIKEFPVSIPGLKSVTNTSPIKGGYEQETDEELRQRYFNKVSSPPTSGNKQHYRLWAQEIPGVGDVQVLPLWNGNGTVKVILVNAYREPAELSLIEAVRANIEDKRPIGAAVTVEAACPVSIDVSAALSLRPGFSIEELLPVARASIETYLKQSAFAVRTVSIAHIVRVLLNLEGVMDVHQLIVNNGTENIIIDESQVPVLGVVTLA